jgi:tRNA (guanine37-N1)-methyltransferase
MIFTILTLFPAMVQAVLRTSMLARAAEAGAVTFQVEDLRQWGSGAHRQVDDAPYGGGAGMVLKVDVVDRALTALREQRTVNHEPNNEAPRIVLLTPQGERFDQRRAEGLAASSRDLILIAGHYEGFDERIRPLVDEELSIGDFVVTGGELPTLLVVDAVTRLLPGALGSSESSVEESFSLRQPSSDARLLEYPQYTRPDSYRPTSRSVGDLGVPPILKSGHHAAIEDWRRTQSLERTRDRRPDLSR